MGRIAAATGPVEKSDDPTGVRPSPTTSFDSPATPWPELTPADLTTLDLIVEGITKVLGFEVAALNVVMGDVLDVVAVAGPQDMREALTGLATPMAEFVDEIQAAEEWGRFRFIPAERSNAILAADSWRTDFEPLDRPDAWQPDDLLVALIRDDEHRVRAVLSVDLPVDGLRPTPERWAALDVAAARAEEAIVAALDRASANERARLARAAHQVVRRAGAERSLEHLLDHTGKAIDEGFRAPLLWLYADLDGGAPYVATYRRGGPAPAALDADLAEELAAVAAQAWRDQDVPVLDTRSELTGAPDVPALVRARETTGCPAVLLVPLGAGQEGAGWLLLGGEGGWSEAERDAALDIGHDLGRAVRTAVAFERERVLADRLRALDSYRSEVIATLAHDLKGPLTSIVGNAELMADTTEPSELEHFRHGIERGAKRIYATVDALLELGRLEDPATPLPDDRVDLVSTVTEAVALTDVAARQAGVTLHLDTTEKPLPVRGDLLELDRAVANLVTNAVKYSEPDGHVHVRASRAGDQVVVEVRDDGLGITPEDQDRLFDMFFRSTNPEAHRRSGTGLGLSIVRSIVARHRGTVEVDSAPGVGSTFTMRFPAYDAPA